MKIDSLNKFQQVFFYLIILLLPVQLGKHFWPQWSYVSGLRVDYLSPTIYLTDILIAALFILWIQSSFKHIKLKFTIYHLPFTIFFLSLLTGIFFSKNPTVGTYGLLKLFEFGFFGFFAAHAIRNRKNLKIITLLLLAGIVFESCLAIGQYLYQGSIGGILYFFGERTFTQQTPGIANVSLDGRLILRPYGTFPHPNVLAGYLTIALAIVISNLKYQISNIQKYLFIFVLLLGSIALFLTMSRVAIFIWMVLTIFYLISLIINRKSFIGLLVVLVCIGSIVIFSPFGSRFLNIAMTDESLIRRKELIVAAVEMTKDNPFVGVGLMNFLPNLPLFQQVTTGSLFTSIQPVHNIFLLIFAEIGIIGLSFFLWFLKKTYQRFKIYDLRFMILSMVLFLGLFDHYFLTLQQGQLLLVFVFGLAWSRIKF